MQVGPSHSESVEQEIDDLCRCRVEPDGYYVFCGINLLLSGDNLHRLNPSPYVNDYIPSCTLSLGGRIHRLTVPYAL